MSLSSRELSLKAKSLFAARLFLQPRLLWSVMLNRFALACVALCCSTAFVHAQSATELSTSVSTIADVELPDAPGAAQGPASTPATPDKPSKRILGIIPNYRAVPVGANLPRQTVKDKFVTAAQDTIDPAQFALSGIVAGAAYVRNATPEFQRGGVAFGRYYWHSLADQAVENTAVEFLVPALTHEDTRYYTLGSGGARKRLIYSVTRIAVVRSDSGKETFNAGEIVGAGIAAVASSRYYPKSQRDASSIIGAYALNLGIDAGSYVLREFDSDLGRFLSRKPKPTPTP